MTAASQVVFGKEDAQAILWAILEKVAGKEKRRDLLRPGRYESNLQVQAQVADLDLTKLIRAVLVVSEDTTRASSRGPDSAHLLACILEKLNQATQERICRELPEAFAAAGNRLPDVKLSAAEMAESLLKRLRAKEQRQVAGNVSCRYQLD